MRAVKLRSGLYEAASCTLHLRGRGGEEVCEMAHGEHDVFLTCCMHL